MRKFFPLDDLTETGINADIPSTSRLWNSLSNMRRGSEGWRKRPGIDRLDTGALPSIQIGDPKILTTFKHPASKPISEILRPTGVGTYNAWTANGAATAWEAVDEVIADDDTTDITATAEDTKVSFTFANLTKTYVGISSLRVHFRVEQTASVNHLFQIQARISGADFDLGDITIPAGTGWRDVSLSFSQNPKTSAAWLDSEIDALEIVIIKGDSSSTAVVAQTETLSTTGSNITNMGVGSSGTIAIPASLQTWVNIANTTLQVTVSFSNSVELNEFGTVEFTKPTGELVASISVGEAGTGLPTSSTQTLTLWWVDTGADSVNVRVVDGNLPQPLFGNVDVTLGNTVRTGTASASTSVEAKITQVYVEVEGDGANDRRNSLLMITDDAFLRMSEDLATYSDIQGTASLPTASTGISWDHATFLDQIYIVNGTDQIFHYPSGSDDFQQLSGNPTGAACASFASRLMLGDILESGTRLPSRLRWSAINDATNWTDASSGNLELDETAGKIVAMRSLVELSDSLVGVLSVYKNTGIYHITATGNPSEPFSRKLMNSSSGCIARGTVVGISNDDGTDAHVFLGQIGGTLDVLSWNGRNITRLGAPVVPIIQAEGDSINLEKAQGIIDTDGNYILLFPTDDNSFLSKALVYNFVHKVWSTWDIGDTTALGRWNPIGIPTITVLGRPDSIAYRFDDSLSNDDTVLFDDVPVVSELVTGNLSLMSPEMERRATLESIWIFYREGDDNTAAEISVSTNGGLTFRASEIAAVTNIGFSGGSQKMLLNRVPVRVNGHKHQVRIKFPFDDGKTEIVQILLEAEESGVQST